MATLYQSPACIAVLNPNGRDPFLDYEHGVGAYNPEVHAPINFHAYAAATYGAFFDKTKEVIRQRDRFDAVLVLIRRRTWISLAAVQQLKAAGFHVLVAWKECGLTQIAQQLQSRRAVKAYQKILLEADGIVSPTLAYPPRCGGISPREFREKLRFVPTPYPVDLPEWNFACGSKEKSGILIGTREFKTLARNHVHALSIVAELAHDLNLPRVTVINSEGQFGVNQLLACKESFPSDCLQIHTTKMSYLNYMALLAEHELVFQMDRSGVPGQVAGDCLLARTLCGGGGSAIERVAFPRLCDDGSLHLDEVIQTIRSVLTDREEYERAVQESQSIASKSLSFRAVAEQFGEWLPAAKSVQSGGVIL